MTTRVLVLGGDGMLGRMIRIHLAADPAFRVDWTSRREDSDSSIRFNADESRSLIDLARCRGGYDYVVNCIAILRNASENPAEAYQINSVFPHELAHLAAEIGFKLVHVSTDAVFPPESGRCLESNIPAPADLYGRTKLLGEPSAPDALTIRCSIIGPNPIKKTGLFEWVLAQRRGAVIKGYDNQLWNGVTTLQFAQLCATIFKEDLFAPLRRESPIHHFCPNAAVTKFELLRLLCMRFRPDVQVKRASGETLNRILETRGLLRRIFGAERSMEVAIEKLSKYIAEVNDG